MGGKGEVLYGILSWDRRLLDNLGKKEPAGPMYSIECLEGSIHQLHLPHCEIGKYRKDFAVCIAFNLLSTFIKIQSYILQL